MRVFFLKEFVRTSFLTFLFLGFGLSSLSLAKEMVSKAHMAAAYDLIKVTKADKNFKSVIGLMMAQQKKMLPTQGPKKQKKIDEMFDELEKEMIADTQNILDAVAKIYVKHLSQKDLEATIAFYKTSTGQNFIAKQPVIMRESMIFGQKWGAKLGAKVARRIREKAKEKGLKL